MGDDFDLIFPTVGGSIPLDHGGPFAHTAPPPQPWEPYVAHRDGVARLAGMSSAFEVKPWGELVDRWHDLGKLPSAFQDHLVRTSDPDTGEEEGGSGRSTTRPSAPATSPRSCRAPVQRHSAVAYAQRAVAAALSAAIPLDGIGNEG